MINTDYKPKVITIIPTFNASKTITQATLSTLNQSGTENHIIFCDDASTDNTLEILKEIKFAYPDNITILSNKTNVGPSKTRNKMLKFIKKNQKKYDYFSFLDADDISCQNRNINQIEYLKSHPECHLVGGQIIIFGKETPKKQPPLPTTIDSSLTMSLFETINMPSTYFSKIDTINKKEFFFSNISIAEDWEFMIRNYQWLNFTNIKEPVCYYRRHDNNTTVNIIDSLDSISTILRKSLLKKALNIEPTDEEMKIHITISPCKFWEIEEQEYLWKKEKTFIIDMDKWIDKLLDANKTQKFVNQEIFKKILTKISNNVKNIIANNKKPSSFRFDLP